MKPVRILVHADTLLNKRGINSILIGVKTIAQLRENIDAVNWKLSSEEMKELDSISECKRPYPYWRHKYFGGRR
jgi:diketogulonate reductase-like aldo/keto reductase